MHSTALVRTGAGTVTAPPKPIAEAFDLPTLRRLATVPDHCGVTTLRGAVVVYDPAILHREKIEVGAFYVVETQRTPSRMEWRTWLESELRSDMMQRSAQPVSPLDTRRQVIQLLDRTPGGQVGWFHRHPGGFCDGPYYDWAVALRFVGKVVGIYAPGFAQQGEA